MKGLILHLLFVLSCAAKTTSTFWTLSKPDLKQFLYSRAQRDGMQDEEDILQFFIVGCRFINQILNSEQFKEYTFSKLLGKGGYGVVFEGKKGEEFVSVKMVFDTPDYRRCNRAKAAYDSVKTVPGIKYIIRMEDPQPHNYENYYVCTVLMEHAQSFDQPILPLTSVTSELNENTNKFVKLVHKIVESFYLLNFVGELYHADIKLENLLWTRNAAGDFEPRMIDFDLTFKKERPGFNPGKVTYTVTYRPPELKAIVPETSVTTVKERDALLKYVYNDEYKEEAWALGKTIKEIISVNLPGLSRTNEKFVKMQETVEKMTRTAIDSRISTKVAFEELSGIVGKLRCII